MWSIIHFLDENTVATVPIIANGFHEKNVLGLIAIVTNILEFNLIQIHNCSSGLKLGHY